MGTADRRSPLSRLPFSLLAMLLGRWTPKPGWFVVILVAVLFAAGHLVKGGITTVQLASVFLTGTLYGWLRPGQRLDCPRRLLSHFLQLGHLLRRRLAPPAPIGRGPADSPWGLGGVLFVLGGIP